MNKSTNSTKTIFKTGKEAFNNIDSFIDSLAAEDKIKFSITVEVDNFHDPNIDNTDPQLLIVANDTLIYNQYLTQGQHHISLEFDSQLNNQIVVSMKGKNSSDTLVIDNEIVRDRSIKILSFSINQFDLMQDPDFFYKQLWAKELGQPISVNSGFWSNSDLGINFISPFILWYQDRTTKNSTVTAELELQNSGNYEKSLSQMLIALEKLQD
jgi:hypothetical protein